MKQIIIVLCIIIVLYSCSNNDPISTITPAKPPSRTELLTNNASKEWKITSAKLNGTEALQNCEKDNIYTFSLNGNSSIDFGVDKCNTSEKKTEDRTWRFLKDDKRLEWISPTDTFFLEVDAIYMDKLQLTQYATLRGNPVRLALIFEAK